MSQWTSEDLEHAFKNNPQLAMYQPTDQVGHQAVEIAEEEGADSAQADQYRAPVVMLADTTKDRPIKFRSKTERRAWSQWRMWIGAICDEADVREFEYEMLSFANLPGGVRYKSDFFILDKNGRLHIVDVKGGSTWKKNHGSGRSASSAVKVAADVYWWFADFYYLYPEKGQWKVEKVEPSSKINRHRLRVTNDLGGSP